MKKYEFKKDVLGKRLNIILRGQFNKDEGMAFIEDYSKQVKQIPKQSEYVLSVNCNEMLLTANDATDALEYCFKLYSESGFKAVEFITSGNKSEVFLNMQFARLGRKVGLQLITK